MSRGIVAGAAVAAAALGVAGLLASGGAMGGDELAVPDAPLAFDLDDRSTAPDPHAVLDSLDLDTLRPVSFRPDPETAEAFDFLVPELFTGTAVDGSDLYGGGPLMLTFVAPDCEFSAVEAEALAALAERDLGITHVVVHTDGAGDGYLDFIEDADLFQQNVIHVDDSELVLWDRFAVTGSPSTVLVDASGQASLTVGSLGHEGLANIAVDLLQPEI